MIADTVLSSALPSLPVALVALVATVQLRDAYYHAHGARVAYWCLRIGHALQFDRDQSRDLYAVGVVHDVGKLWMPRSILHGDAPLTQSQQMTMRRHAAMGGTIVGMSMPEHAQAVRHHHERWDGRGYPDKLSGEQIPLASRVVAVADAYDAMTSDRSYRAAMPQQDALRALVAGSGSQFDPRIVDTMLRVITEDNKRRPSGGGVDVPMMAAD